VNAGTPGIMRMRLTTSRFASGMFSTWRCCTVALTSGDVVRTNDDPAATVTTSSI
jgi:hypothetical protein